MIVKPLIPTPVRPNHLTAVRLACGLAAAAAFAVGESPWVHAGAALFVVSMLLDRADGDLARLTGRTSRGGHLFDLVADATSNALAFVGIGVGLMGSGLGMWAPVLGVAAGVGIAVVLVAVLGIQAREGTGAAGSPTAAGFDADDAMLAVPVAVWLGWREELLVAAAIGAPAFALLFLVLHLRRR